ncbi:SAM-dependent methyltransferase [Pseudanabaena sp. FACHB-1998]|uniref:SAM-dependent methyltransferase n=1 Tax=Pseudanabaena sp. FACHB-1998 TaxID=2692858 RepID=UPI0016816028|nr:SAM-dependent methyltransferase [Pseudanabaena sp. FACHB-1998]MBD2176412.1 SAM-dependent methyltransferase [Pseudanabaena sp. FACHB-1998]
MILDNIVPFGRSKAEYELMFALTESDRQKTIIGIGDGPASFNAEMTAAGYQVTSIDPIYQFTGAEIKSRFDACVDGIIEQVIKSPSNWIWKYHKSPADLQANREKAIALFLEDYEQGKSASRYLKAELPRLDFADQQFQLALCSHFLFLYSAHLSLEFHLDSIRELCRIAEEVRIFPILTLAQERSPYLDTVRESLAKDGITSEIIQVAYELQRGGNQMIIFKNYRTYGKSTN